MKFYLKTDTENKLLDDKSGSKITIFIINKILEDNNNYIVLDNLYKNINKYSKK